MIIKQKLTDLESGPVTVPGDAKFQFKNKSKSSYVLRQTSHSSDIDGVT